MRHRKKIWWRFATNSSDYENRFIFLWIDTPGYLDNTHLDLSILVQRTVDITTSNRIPWVPCEDVDRSKWPSRNCIASSNPWPLYSLCRTTWNFSTNLRRRHVRRTRCCKCIREHLVFYHLEAQRRWWYQAVPKIIDVLHDAESPETQTEKTLITGSQFEMNGTIWKMLLKLISCIDDSQLEYPRSSFCFVNWEFLGTFRVRKKKESEEIYER